MEKITLLLLIPFLIVCSCENQPDPEWESAKYLASDKNRLSCRIDSLHQVALSLWDTVTLELDKQLPSDMPGNERRNMLKVRNASLIQMFMVFDSLPSHVQQVVTLAGQKDSLLNQEMRQLMDTFLLRESALDSLLIGLEEKQVSDYHTQVEQIEIMSQAPCEVSQKK